MVVLADRDDVRIADDLREPGRVLARQAERHIGQLSHGANDSASEEARATGFSDGVKIDGVASTCVRSTGSSGRPSYVDRTAGQRPGFRYRLRLEMYWTTPSGTRYQTGRPAATRARQSLDEIAMAGTSTVVTDPWGRWPSASS